ncbi:MAG: UvrD-helicase domain-containing protein [Lachnospiraceae bacterium]|jgi:uncharacterized protein (TIGR00375 family)|nr:UvrD-helicase domain-containing protein [Lachnospiraceae bacterium]
MYIADLHIHSRYSRATSKECIPEYLELWARKKGIDLLGTGDFTHPAWRKELSEKLIPAEEGLYRLREDLQLKDAVMGENHSPRFVVSGEISSIYKKNGQVRKVHNMILLPGLREAELLSARLELIGNLHSDGRPILGLDSRDLLEITLEVCPRAIFVPAHIWTPHFSMFGAFSGFDTVEECFEDLTSYIHAIETGLSSDPPMNWRLSALDRFQMISNSDAHSPSKLGREANLMDISLSYDGLYGAIQKGKGLAGTIEFFPEEGKYHYDGHRKCHLCLSPSQAEKYQGKCPVCGKKLTLGVSHRIDQLADRGEGFIRPGAASFESLVPLPEVIAASTGHGTASVRVQRIYRDMLAGLGNEFSILRQCPIEKIQSLCGYQIGEGIRRLRQGSVQRRPGFDGEYGTIALFEPSELASVEGQMSLFGVDGIWPMSGGKAESRSRSWQEEVQVEDKNPPINTEQEKVMADPELNEAQLQAVHAISSRIAVIAGPGTGKTKTLILRILHLLLNRRVRPSQITAVTFTNKAAQEMKSRLAETLGKKGAAKRVRIGTFHSLCYDILKASGEEFTLVEENAAMELVREVAQELEIKDSAKILRQKISRKKTGLDSFKDETEELDLAVKTYQSRLDSLSALDFDDLLIRALDMAETNPPAFPYLLVDEFQDINPLQYRLIQAWSKGGRELFVIGDPNQAIYGFRGADTESFQRFCQEENTETIRLVKNYRSSPEILRTSMAVIKSTPDTLEAVQKSSYPVRMVQAAKEREEAIFIAKEINRLIGGIDMLDAQNRGFCQEENLPRSFADIAILYRTHRQTELLELCLKREGIPYVVTGREDFLEEDIVRGSLGFFRSLLNPKDDLSRKLCLKLLWDEKKEGRPVCDYLSLTVKYKDLSRQRKPQSLWELWRKDMGFFEDPAMEKLTSMAVFYKTMEEMLIALDFGRESDLKRWGGKRYTSDAVTLMTIHGSKGLEFPAVFLYGLKAGTIPLEFKGRETDWEEERRLLYVAMTRAKEELIMTSSGELSPFIKQLPENILQREKMENIYKKEKNGHQMNLFER